mmetsp:Transcript_13268/g.29236  ORF Transcript_13268/g.29236 Transcript_13268/m.29236 type:complete len:411 (+) Transcript_13268:420-1652(+)
MEDLAGHPRDLRRRRRCHPRHLPQDPLPPHRRPLRPLAPRRNPRHPCALPLPPPGHYAHRARRGGALPHARLLRSHGGVRAPRLDSGKRLGGRDPRHPGPVPQVAGRPGAEAGGARAPRDDGDGGRFVPRAPRRRKGDGAPGPVCPAGTGRGGDAVHAAAHRGGGGRRRRPHRSGGKDGVPQRQAAVHPRGAFPAQVCGGGEAAAGASALVRPRASEGGQLRALRAALPFATEGEVEEGGGLGQRESDGAPRTGVRRRRVQRILSQTLATPPRLRGVRRSPPTPARRPHEPPRRRPPGRRPSRPRPRPGRRLRPLRKSGLLPLGAVLHGRAPHQGVSRAQLGRLRALGRDRHGAAALPSSGQGADADDGHREGGGDVSGGGEERARAQRSGAVTFREEERSEHVLNGVGR